MQHWIYRFLSMLQVMIVCGIVSSDGNRSGECESFSDPKAIGFVV